MEHTKRTSETIFHSKNSTNIARGKKSGAMPHPADIHVGKRMRLMRKLLGMSQEKLGALLGVTFQQIQKYEHGANRISAGRLYDLSRVMRVPVGFFFENMNNESLPSENVSADRQTGTRADNPRYSNEYLGIFSAYDKLKNPELRQCLRRLILLLGGGL